MKYAVLINSGMADRPMPEYRNITPLSQAYKPCMDRLAAYAETGLVKTAAINELPLAEKSVLSLLGYDAAQYFHGSSPFYAAAGGVFPREDEVVFRCGTVQLSDNQTILSWQPCRERELPFGNDIFRFVHGTDGTVFLLWKQGEPCAGEFLPPWKALHLCTDNCLPKGDFVQPIRAIIEQSRIHWQNRSLWIWDAGTAPCLPPFPLSGTVISDVDFVRGIAALAGLSCRHNTDCLSQTALQELSDGKDMVILYTNDTVACGLHGDTDGKIHAIERFDRDIVAPMFSGLCRLEKDFGILIVSDTAVPVHQKQQTGDPVPYLLYRSNAPQKSGISRWDENTAADSVHYLAAPHALMRQFLGSAAG